MPSLVVLARIAGRLAPAARGDRCLAALLVLVLFVMWLLASGHELVPALAAAVTLSWAADRTTRRQITRAEGVDA